MFRAFFPAFICPKHVEQILIAIKHSVASSWFSSLRLYYDARTNIYQNRYWVSNLGDLDSNRGPEAGYPV